MVRGFPIPLAIHPHLKQGNVLLNSKNMLLAGFQTQFLQAPVKYRILKVIVLRGPDS
jgi:hypothetical protein